MGLGEREGLGTCHSKANHPTVRIRRHDQRGEEENRGRGATLSLRRSADGSAGSALRELGRKAGMLGSDFRNLPKLRAGIGHPASLEIDFSEAKSRFRRL